MRLHCLLFFSVHRHTKCLRYCLQNMQDECTQVLKVSLDDDPWDFLVGALGKRKGPLFGGEQSHEETTVVEKSTRPSSNEEQPHLETTASTGKDQSLSLQRSAQEGARTEEIAARDCSSPRVTDTQKWTSSGTLTQPSSPDLTYIR